jgi:hypothetical protein
MVANSVSPANNSLLIPYLAVATAASALNLAAALAAVSDALLVRGGGRLWF